VIRDREAGAGGSRRLRAMLAAFVTILLVLALGPGRAGPPVVPDRAHYALLTAGEAVLAAPERTPWKRPQGESRDGDSPALAPTAPTAFAATARQLGWPMPPDAPAGNASASLPPARGPPGAA
jgi:hypothetical protein